MKSLIKYNFVLIIISLLLIALGIVIVLINNKNKMITITFDTSGGSYVESITINKKEKIKEPSMPIKEGFTFEGWYYNGKIFDFNSSINEDIILKAKWKNDGSLEIYTISFDSLGGSSVESIEVAKGSTITEPPHPTKKGYSFNGWYFKEELFDFNMTINDSITLVAKWTKGEGNDIKTSRGENEIKGNNTVLNNVNEIDKMSEEEINNILNNLKGKWYYEKNVDNEVYLDGHDTYYLDKKVFELYWEGIDLYKSELTKNSHAASRFLYYPVDSNSLKDFMNTFHITSVTKDKLVINKKYTFNRNKKTVDYSQFDKYLGTWYKISGNGMSEVVISKEADSYGNIFFRVGNYTAEGIDNRKIAEKDTVFDKYTLWSGNNLKIDNSIYSKNKNDVPIPLHNFEIKLSKEENIKLGDEIEATIIPNPKNATDTTGKWEVGNSSVAIITQTGLIKIKAFGSTSISFTSNDAGKMTKTVYINVEEVQAKEITLSISSITMMPGEEKTFNYFINPTDTYNKDVSTMVSQFGVVETVSASNGVIKIKALKPGTITYTVEHDKTRLDASITVTVLPINVTGLLLDCNTINMLRGDKKTITATITPNNASDKTIIWEVSDSNIIKVNNGIVSALKKGSATVTATTKDGNHKQSCEVIVENPELKAKGSVSKNTLTIGNVTNSSIAGRVNAEGGSGTYSYYDIKLYKDDVLIASSTDHTSSTLSVSYTSGRYYIEYLVRDSEGNEVTGISNIYTY